MAKIITIGPTLLVLACAALIHQFQVLESLDRRYADALIRIGPAPVVVDEATIPDVAVVTIDPRSLRAFDDWPWPRSRHADAIAALAYRTAAAEVLGGDFADRRRNPRTQGLELALEIDFDVAEACLAKGKYTETSDPSRKGATLVYAPLVAAQIPLAC